MSERVGFIGRIKNYYGEVRTEMSKVVWPSREDLKTYTAVVLVATAIIATILYGWDFILGRVMEVLFVRGGS